MKTMKGRNTEIQSIAASSLAILLLTAILVTGIYFMGRNNTIGIIGIITSVILIIALSVGLVIGIFFVKAGKNIMGFNFFSTLNGFSGDDSYTETNFGAGDNKIKSIDIGWACGKVEIKKSNDGSISVSEEGDNDKYRMCWKIEGGKLSIRYSKNASLISANLPKKTLILALPDGFGLDRLDVKCASSSIDISEITAEKLNIDTASGKTYISDSNVTECDIDSASGGVEVTALKADSISVDTASGHTSFSDCECKTLKADSASGGLSYSGKADRIRCNSASGGVELRLTECPESINIDSMSGGTRIYLPADSGFDADIDSMSGKLDCSFDNIEMSKKHVSRKGNKIAKIDIDSMSGGVSIMPIN